MTEQDKNPDVLKVPEEFTDETPTPPHGLSLDAREWQNTDEDVRDLDFTKFRTDR